MKELDTLEVNTAIKQHNIMRCTKGQFMNESNTLAGNSIFGTSVRRSCGRHSGGRLLAMT